MNLKGFLYCLIATISWGTMFPIMGNALKYLDPFNFTTIRYGIAGIVFMLLLIIKEGLSAFNLKGEKWILAWLFGSFGFAGFGFLVFLGQSIAGPHGAFTASIIMAAMPMLSILVIWMLKNIKPHISTFFFIILSFSGVILVLTNGNFKYIVNSSTNLTANILIILGALCWVLYTIGSSYFPNWSTIKYTTITTLLGMISIVGINILLIYSDIIYIPHIADVIIVIPHLLYMSIIAGVISVLCWNMGNKIIGPTNGILFMNIVPITAFIVSSFNGIIPTHIQIIGAIITITSLIFNNLNQRKILKKDHQC